VTGTLHPYGGKSEAPGTKPQGYRRPKSTESIILPALLLLAMNRIVKSIVDYLQMIME